MAFGPVGVKQGLSSGTVVLKRISSSSTEQIRFTIGPYCLQREVRKGNQENLFPSSRILRHTALTQLAQACCDAFTLARIAGHSSITITQKDIHPQSDAIERAFAPLAATPAIGQGNERTDHSKMANTTR
jgi:integrase